MGCPAKTVANKGGGAALIRMPDTAKAIIRAAQQGVRDWANGQTLEDLGMDPPRIDRIRQMNDERLSIWGDHVLTDRRLLPVSVKTRLGYDSIVITDIHSLLEAAQRIRTTGVDGVLIGRASFGNPWLFRNRDQMKKLLNENINLTVDQLPNIIPSREERLVMALEHANVHANLKARITTSRCVSI